MSDKEQDEAGPAGAVVARREHDWQSGVHIAATVAEALADAEDADPTELTPSLYECVDPEALDALFSPREDGERRTAMGRVTFDYVDYEVVVTSGGHVLVHE